jgi:diguanylate cyclase (GGDEF)-like protein
MTIFALSHKQAFHGLTVRAFLLIPPVLYAAARFSNRIATAVLVAVSFLVLYAIKQNHQPFGDLPLRETVISAQEFIFIMSIMSLGFASLLSQHRMNTRELEARVQERTVELSAANKQLEELAITDPLTNLLNRRALIDVLQREIAREKRYGHGLALIVFDIDHFKQVNDRYGHVAGDQVLRDVASVSRRVVRSTDAMARYGGEEFAVVASEIDRHGAMKLAEHMLAAIRSANIAVDHDLLRITASFGVAMMHSDDQNPEQIIQRADQALYAAKAAGRDQVVAE